MAACTAVRAVGRSNPLERSGGPRSKPNKTLACQIDGECRLNGFNEHQAVFPSILAGRSEQKPLVGKLRVVTGGHGAQVSQEQFDKIMFLINKGIEEGAKLEIGGKRYGVLPFGSIPFLVQHHCVNADSR